MAGRIEHAHSDFLEILATGGLVRAFFAVLHFGPSCCSIDVGAMRDTEKKGRSSRPALKRSCHSLSVAEYNFSILPIPATLARVLNATWPAGERP
jgi:hypothetical protein